MSRRVDERVLSPNEAGLTRWHVPDGPQRVLRELLLRGLDREHLRPAAMLVVELDAQLSRQRSEKEAA